MLFLLPLDKLSKAIPVHQQALINTNIVNCVYSRFISNLITANGVTDAHKKFDHHCVYLNTCIGSKNYDLFILIVLAYITFLVKLIGQNIWIFVVFQQSSAMGEQLRPYIKTQWMLIVIIILSSILLILSLVLCFPFSYVLLLGHHHARIHPVIRYRIEEITSIDRAI